eukprot:8341507-Alexandrium_andersonii.AAC.1
MRSPSPLVKVSSGPEVQPEGAAIPVRLTGQRALSAARNRRKSEEPPSSRPDAGGAARKRGASCVWAFGM